MRGVREAVLLAAAFMALFLVLALVSYDRADPGWSSTGINLPPENLGGLIGAWIADIALSIFGWLAFMLPWIILGGGLVLYRDKPNRLGENPGIRGAAMFIVLIASCALCGMHAAGHPSLTPQGSGGIVGAAVALMLIELFSPVGASLLLLMIVLGALPLALRFSWLNLMDALGARALALFDRVLLLLAERKEQRQAAHEQKLREQRAVPAVIDVEPAPVTAAPTEVKEESAPVKALSKLKAKSKRKPKAAKVPENQLSLPIPEVESGDTQVKYTGDPLPPVSMFDLASQDALTYSEDDLEQMSRDS